VSVSSVAVVVLLTGWISQVLMARGVTTRAARGVLGSVPLIVGGLILAAMPYTDVAGLQIALLVVGTGLSGSIYVVCPPMLGEFTPVAQRGAGSESSCRKPSPAILQGLRQKVSPILYVGCSADV